MEILKILEQIIGHLAWPVVALIIASRFQKEISALLGRVKRATYKGVELDLESAFKEVKNEAQDAGITIMYPASSFAKENFEAMNQAPEWIFIKSWQEMEQLLISAHERKIGKLVKSRSISMIIKALIDHSILNSEMGMLVKKMFEIRNKIVHMPDAQLTRGELLEWLGLSRSITDRLSQQLLNN